MVIKQTEIINKLYHTHTFRCKHATGDISDYCLSAIMKGVKVLGFSDHTPLPDGRWSEVRMNMSELTDYIAKIETAKIEFPDLKILKGMECEYDESIDGFYREELLNKLEFDYLIGSAHWIYNENKWQIVFEQINKVSYLKEYVKYLIKAMESKLFLFIAHPDAFMNSYVNWDDNSKACAKELIKSAAKLKIPLEINALGFQKKWIHSLLEKRPPYPYNPFWEMCAEYNIEVVLSTDAHSPSEIMTNAKPVIDIAKKFNLKTADFSHIENKHNKKTNNI